jgi:two-component system sensor histidine kinase YesM
LGFVLPFLIPLIVLGTLSVLIIYRYVAQNEASNNIRVHKQMHSNVEMLFDELETLYMHFVASAFQFNHLKAILNNPAPSLQDLKELASIKNFIDSPAVARPYIDSIYIYLNNDHGRFITSTTGGPMEFEEFYDTSWHASYLAHQGMNDTPVWTEKRSFHKYNLPNFEANVISLYQMLDVQEKNDGVIVLNIRLDYLQDQLELLHTLNGQYLFMGDSRGNVILQNQASLPPVTSTAALLNNPAGFIGASSLGYAISISSSDNYGFQFISVTPKASVYALPIRLALYTAGAAGLSFLAAVILSLVFSRRHVRNIRQIFNLLNDAEKGCSPSTRAKKQDLHHYIIERILVNFLEKKYLSTQLTERKAMAELMELSALQAQLNPHFLLNTLETIQWKAVSLAGSMNNEVSSMIQHLGDILKSALNYEERMIPLREELQHVETYIAIQKMRYKESFNVLWSCGENLGETRVIKLLLQPILENSLYHGTRPLKSRSGLIKIKIRKDGQFLRISISDNGVGMARSRLAELRRQLNSPVEQGGHSHIGIFNTNKRLLLSYGTCYEFRMYSKPGWGTMTKITVPVQPGVQASHTLPDMFADSKAV